MPYLYRSAADAFVGTTNLTAIHYHPTVTFRNTEAISDLVNQMGNGTETTSRFAWTGHILTNNDRSASSSDHHAVVMTPSHTTHYVSFANLSAEEVKRQSRYELLHEAAHQIGAPDHYCYGNRDNNLTNKCRNLSRDCFRCDHDLDDPPTCVMTGIDGIEDIENPINELFCIRCSGQNGFIRTHLRDHH